MIVRDATRADIANLSRVEMTATRAAYAETLLTEAAPAFGIEESFEAWNWIFDCMATENNFVLAAFGVGDELTGFISAGPERTGDPIYIGEVYDLSVAPTYHRLGIGRQLILAAAQTFLDRGIESMIVSAWAKSARTCGLYTSVGGYPIRLGREEISSEFFDIITYGWRNISSINK